MKKLIRLFVVLAVALVWVGPVAADGDNGDGNGDGAEDEVGQGQNLDGALVIGRGSDTTYVVTKLLGNQYTFSQTGEDEVETENVEGDIILNAPPEGSSVGIEQLASYQVDDADGALPTAFARSSRGPRLPDTSDNPDPGGLRFTSFARDGITVITFGGDAGPSAPVESLTQEQLTGIFVTCEITNWAQVGGLDAQIEVYTIQEGSGTRSVFDDFVGGDSSSCITDPNNIIFENSANPILSADEGVEPDERGRAIFPFSFGRLSTSAITDDVKPLAIDGIEPSPTTIGDESFPFTRDLYFVTVADPSSATDPESAEAAVRFVDWICKGEDEHTEDPIFGTNYAEIINDTIQGSGFGLIDECEVIDTEAAASDAEAAASDAEIAAELPAAGVAGAEMPVGFLAAGALVAGAAATRFV